MSMLYLMIVMFSRNNLTMPVFFQYQKVTLLNLLFFSQYQKVIFSVSKRYFSISKGYTSNFFRFQESFKIKGFKAFFLQKFHS